MIEFAYAIGREVLQLWLIFELLTALRSTADEDNDIVKLANRATFSPHLELFENLRILTICLAICLDFFHILTE
jgi:hypothetical protein